MTDLEMTKLCAEAMGYKSIKLGSERGPGKEPFDTVWVAHSEDADHLIYQVLNGLFADAQAMALVKKLFLSIERTDDRIGEMEWMVDGDIVVYGQDLNRAIVECVAKMQKTTVGRESRTILPPPAEPSTER